MENSATIIRRIKIIVSYLVLISVIAIVIYLIKRPAETCFDKKLNQDEKGIDCGGPCSPCQNTTNFQAKDITVGEIAFTLGGNNTYDVVAQLINPNDATGAKTFNYVFTLKDSNGLIIAKSEGISYILPADTKYVAELNIKTDNNAIPVSANIEISAVRWEKLPNIDKPEIGVYNKKFGPALNGDGSEAEGTLRNESYYDVEQIDAVIILRDEEKKIIGISTTQRNSVRSREDQFFRVIWPYSLGGNVARMDVYPQVNIFN